MRIILEPTEDQTNKEYPQHRVVIEYPHEELDLWAVGELLRGALVAWGFDAKSVDELIDLK